MKTKHFLCCLALLAVCFTACKPDKEEPELPIEIPILVTGVTLNYEELTLIPGDTITLIAIVQPDDTDDKTVTWKSSNTEVVTVDDKGWVTAITNGEATITATTQDGSKKATCVVTVDYRNQWMGTYDFNIAYSYPTFLPHPEIDGAVIIVYKDTTYFYLGSVGKSASHSNKILVDWGNDTIGTVNYKLFTQKSELTIDSSGELSYPEYGGFGYNEFFPPAYIKGDTICFIICCGGLGAHESWNVKGQKIKNADENHSPLK